MIRPALRHLHKTDPVMKALIRRIGPCTFAPRRHQSLYEVLVRAVAHQQLHGRAAEAILGRLVALYPGKRFPEPEDILATSMKTLRRVGFSRAKILAIKHIARKTLSGVVPTRRAAARMTDEDMIVRLTELRGVGRWTVEMLLMFHLGRPDVLPVDDFGIREGFRITYGLRKQPTPKQLLLHGERWRPHRTIASWYLWRAVEHAKRAAAK